MSGESDHRILIEGADSDMTSKYADDSILKDSATTPKTHNLIQEEDS